MATATVEQAKVTPIKTPAPVPIKVGIFGGQGAGKTTSAALLAIALSKQVYGGAPVLVTDTEPGWQFVRPLFAMEKVELIQRTVPTFKAMCRDLEEAQKLGACVWAVDSLTIIWQELMQAFKARNNGFIPIDKWGDIKAMWHDYTRLFLNSPLSTFALGRVKADLEEVEDEKNPAKTKLVKIGTKLNAGGGESFGYEPHLLLELSLERKNRTVKKQEREAEGRMVHRVDVLKDRTWALNGKTLRWSDKPRYEPGGYSTVWSSIKPHFEAVQKTMAMVTIGSGSSSDLISEDGNSEWYERKQRKEVLSAELHATMDALWGGTAVAAKQMRMKVFEHIFGFKSKEAADAAPLDKIERGVRILQAFERRVKQDAKLLSTDELNILATLDIDIHEFDEGQAEASDLPF